MSTYTTIWTAQVDCDSCGGQWEVSKKFDEVCRSKGRTFWCPYCGHKWQYGETAEQRLQKEKQRLNEKLAREIARHDQTRAEKERIERFRRAQKAQATKLRRRAAAGVCPCCSRTFENLARHMKNKHPEYAK